MNQRKIIAVLVVIAALALLTSGVLFNNTIFSPVETNAQQAQDNVFDTINTLAKNNAASPNYKTTLKITQMLLNNLSVLEIPSPSADAIVEQVATAHLNGSSQIDENNIAKAVNELAGRSSAPDYAFTNTEQVKVVRTVLNRLMPDVVSPSGEMNDLESFAVFTATLSQKVDNDAFMVTPAEFTNSLANPVAQPFPGSTAANQAGLEVSEPSKKAIEMQSVVSNFAGINDGITADQIISEIGIQ